MTLISTSGCSRFHCGIADATISSTAGKAARSGSAGPARVALEQAQAGTQPCATTASTRALRSRSLHPPFATARFRSATESAFRIIGRSAIVSIEGKSRGVRAARRGRRAGSTARPGGAAGLADNEARRRHLTRGLSPASSCNIAAAARRPISCAGWCTVRQRRDRIQRGRQVVEADQRHVIGHAQRPRGAAPGPRRRPSGRWRQRWRVKGRAAVEQALDRRRPLSS